MIIFVLLFCFDFCFGYDAVERRQKMMRTDEGNNSSWLVEDGVVDIQLLRCQRS